MQYPLKKALFILLFTLTIISCKKTSDDSIHSSLTINEHKKIIEKAQTVLTNDLIEMFYSNAYQASCNFAEYLNISTAFYSKQNNKIHNPLFLFDFFRDLKGGSNYFIGHQSIISSNKKFSFKTGFNYHSYKGKYTWNSQNKVWQKTKSDKIIFAFPSKKSRAYNNAELIISSYTEVYSEKLNEYYPSLIKFELFIDKIKEADYVFHATYNEAGVPVTCYSTLFVNPFLYQSNAILKQDKIISDFSLKHNNSSLITSNAEIQLNSNGIISTIDGFFLVGNIKVCGNINVLDMYKIENPSIAEINQNIKLSINYADDNYKIADFDWYINTEFFNQIRVDKPSIRLVFQDGNKINASVFFERVINEYQCYLEDFGRRIFLMK